MAMTPDRAKFNKEVEKGLLDRGVSIPVRAMTEQETMEQRIKIQADQIASLKRHIGRLETQIANELLDDDGSPLTPHGEAIAAGDGTLHGAIDYWQQQAFTMAAGQCCVKDGGLMSDDHGHQYCDMERQRDELKADLAAAQEARQRAEALAEEYKKDAERYRYLRSRDKDEVFNNDGVKAGVWIDCTAEDGTLQLLTFEDADAAIDAVFAGEPK